VSIGTTKLNLRMVMFCGFVDPFSLFVGSKNETVFWPQKRAHFTSLVGFLNREAERRGRKMGPFLGGLEPQNETLPGTIRSTFGSRFQPHFWVPPRADQRFSGRSACYHSQPPDLICQIPSVSFLLPPSCSFFCLPRSVNLIAKRPRILMP
jgi:hypothetical protein